MKTRPTTRTRVALALIGAAALAGAAACGTANTTTPSPAPPPAASAPASPAAGSASGSSMSGSSMAGMIHIKSFAYSGPDSVPAGATVTVMNMDSEAHTVTADDGSFDAVVKAGASVTFTAPMKPGAYPYHCSYHSNMHGILTVK